MKRGVSSRVVVATGFLLSSLMILSCIPGELESTNVPVMRAFDHYSHAPISVDSDAELASMASSEGWPGDGSSSNPYRISSYSIAAAGAQSCIYIGNTTVHFVIWDCDVQDATEAGIKLFNVSNGRIWLNNCTSDGYYGIVVVASEDIIVEENQCKLNQYGMRVTSSQNVTVSRNICTLNGEGIYVYYSASSNINNNTCTYNNETGGFPEGFGIHLSNSSRNTVENNTCYSNMGLNTPGSGIYLDRSENNTIAENECRWHNGVGIVLNLTSSNNTIRGNTCSENWGGIALWSSSWNSVDNNTCSLNDHGGGGILIYQSTDNTLRRNSCAMNKYMSLWPGGLLGHGIHIMFGSSRNHVIENNCSSNEGDGILLESSTSCDLLRNTCTGSLRDPTFQWGYGIQVRGSASILVEENNCSGNVLSGIYVALTTDGKVLNNSCFNNWYNGIRTYSETGAQKHVIRGNNCSWNENHGIECISAGAVFNKPDVIEYNNCSRNTQNGIHISGGLYASVLSNNLSHNARAGVHLLACANCRLSGNVMTENGISIWGTVVGAFILNDIDTSNTVNGKPVRFIKNQTAGTVPSGAGEVIIVNCTNIVIQDQTFESSSIGILMAYSNNNNIHNNSCVGGVYGIHMVSSDDNSIDNCTFGFNSEYGMYLESGCDRNTILDTALVANTLYGIYVNGGKNRIWNNTFADNNGAGAVYDPSHIQAYDSSSNFWNSTSGRGNYWSDWTFPDSDFDGIVDFPYEIAPAGAPVVQDNHPLATPTVVIIPEFGDVAPFTAILFALALLCSLRWRRGR